MKPSVFFITLSFIINAAFAQQRSPRSVLAAPYTNLIFEDNFRSDSIGSFPRKWRLGWCNGDKYELNPKYCSVQKSDTANVLAIHTDPSFTTIIEPVKSGRYYLSDSFLLELDVLLGSGKAFFDLGFHCIGQGACLGQSFSIYKHRSRGFVFDIFANLGAGGNEQKTYSHSSLLPSRFDPSLWHHCSFFYRRGEITCYIDTARVYYIAHCGYAPGSFMLSAAQDSTVRVRNIRVATGATVYSFKALTEKGKLSTDIIQFSTGSADIEQQSQEIIKQMAAWLKTNSRVRLQIDGHTDNDGDETMNMQLSQARADEVKKHLVAYGIDAGRVTAKGYGATKPLQPNTTPEGKAANRRVEFINLK